MKSATVAAAVLVLAACGSLPDVAPFADATAEVHRSVDAAGSAAVGALRGVGERWTDAERERLDQAVASIEKDWEERRAATAALVDYADALASLAAAGASGGEAAREVAAGVEGLLGKLGVSGAISASGVVEFAALVSGAVAEARAAGSMGRAVEAAHPAVLRAAALLDADLADAAVLVEAARVPLRSARKAAHAGDLDYRAALVERRARLVAECAAAIRAGTPPPTPSLHDADVQLNLTQSWYAPLESSLAAIDARLDEDLALIARTRRLLAAWADAHGSLGAALEAGRGVNVRRLLALAEDVRRLAEDRRQP